MHATKLPDGPPAHLLTGHATALHHDRLGCFTGWARDYGDFVPLRLGPRRGFLLSHPDYLRAVLVSQQPNFIRPYPVRQSRTTFGDSMFITSGTSTPPPRPWWPAPSGCWPAGATGNAATSTKR